MEIQYDSIRHFKTMEYKKCQLSHFHVRSTLLSSPSICQVFAEKPAINLVSAMNLFLLFVQQKLLCFAIAKNQFRHHYGKGGAAFNWEKIASSKQCQKKQVVTKQ